MKSKLEIPETNAFRLLQLNPDPIAQIIGDPLAFSGWSLQGFGMLRLYLTPDIRLHVWDNTYRPYPTPSLVHDHPWDFRSVVLAGELRNRRYIPDYHYPETFEVFEYATIKCGPGGGLVRNFFDRITLHALPDEVFRPGDVYEQAANEIHASNPLTGTVTLVERYKKSDPDHAHVFWPANEKWVSAEPRPATDQEVLDICSKVAFGPPPTLGKFLEKAQLI